VYIVPVGVLMGFKARHDEFPVYMEMLAAQTARNKINWTLDGQPVSMDQASAIAKRLFAHLIMVARGEASDKDKFSLNQKTPPGQSSVQHDSSLPARPKSFGTSDSKVELLKPEWLLDENPAPQSQHLQSQHLQSQSQSGHPLQQSSSGQQFGQPPFRQSQENQSQTGPQQFFANQSASGNSQGSSAASGYPAPHISPVNAPNVSPQNQMKSQMQAASQMQGNVQDLLQQNLVLVLNECNQFAGALDQQLELLTPIGVKSIQNQDMETASEVMQRAKRLKALLDAVVTFTNEWKTSSK
jgi:hypothetical protein